MALFAREPPRRISREALPSLALVKAMKKARISSLLAFSLPLLVCGLALFSASAVRAAECPASAPDQLRERRALAKEWFARAEAAENAGKDVEAVRAYTCSMRMMAHPSTAYNLARAAERAGDVELALKSYQVYLTLKADAADKDEVTGKIRDLQAKIKEVKEIDVGEGPPTTEPPPVEEKLNVPLEAPEENPVRPVSPERAPRVTERGGEGRGSSHLPAWVVGGVGVAALASGIIMNIVARNDMDTCQSKFRQNLLPDAQSACSSAKPAAYASYAMFGVAGAAAIVEGVLLYRIWASHGSSSDDTSLSLGWMPGGLSASARGRF
jgi:tetratricopeptide (TPR) repeat protein